MGIRLVITVLCGVGLYAAIFMLRKTQRAERGELTEPSVVETPRARLFASIPNALIGTAYYPMVAVAVWFAHTPLTIAVLLAAVAFAAATSLVLMYSLLFVTRMPCPFCWTSNITNCTLAVCTSMLWLNASWR